MLRLQKNQPTKIALTLAEKTTVSTYYPYFRFNQQDGNQNYAFHLNSIESSERFDLFELTTVMTTGRYDYEVYQSLTETDTDYDNMILLEIGKAEIYE